MSCIRIGPCGESFSRIFISLLATVAELFYDVVVRKISAFPDSAFYCFGSVPRFRAICMA